MPAWNSTSNVMMTVLLVSGEAFSGNGDGGGDRISEDNSLGSKPLDRLEDNVRRSKLSGVHGPVHLGPTLARLTSTPTTLAACASSKMAMSSGEKRRKSRLPPSSARTPCGSISHLPIFFSN